MKTDMRKHRADEIPTMDLEGLYIGNLNTVDADLVLPSEGRFGSKFRWFTGESRFIEEDGTVHRPLYGMGNRKVTLRVRAEYNAFFCEKEFTATVLQEEKETVITAVHKVRISAAFGEKPGLPPVVVADCADGRRMTVPVKWEDYEPVMEKGTIYVKGMAEKDGKLGLEVWGEISFVESKKEAEPLKKKLHYFPIQEVRLLEGTIYYEYQQHMLKYLLHQDNGQMLYNFRREAGLDTRGAEPMTGWDEEGCRLKGHTTGHYLSGLALAFGVTGEKRFLEKIEDMVTGLSECQTALAASGNCRRGFLSAYSEEQFDLLEQFTSYPEIWAPYYTLDKIMSGLYDCWKIAGNEKAGEILALMGDWVYSRLSRLPREVLDKMWSMYIAGEFGGMQGTMVKLYKMSGKAAYLKAAEMFSNEKLFYPMEHNEDTLEDMHANQHIPQIIGAMELFDVLGEERYWKIGMNFWKIVTGGHSYCNGGTGETEMFHRAGTVCDYLTDKSEESCASYNMLRLTAQLSACTADGNLMDYYDNVLRNHILASCSHTDDGGTTYFLPLGPGEKKEYSTEENTCCHGTGMESRFRYMEHIYACDGESVYINLLIDSILSSPPHLEIRSEEETGSVKIICGENMEKNLKIHIPSWAKKDFSVWVNGDEIPDPELEEGYLCLPRRPHGGDVILLRLPMELRILENKTDERFVNLAYGPYLLAALSDRKEFLEVPELSDMVKQKESFCFKTGELTFLPLARINLQPYHVYFRNRG